MLKQERYVLSVSYQPNGEEYRRFMLMDRKLMKTRSVFPDKIQLPPDVLEKIALVKLRKGSFEDSDIGMWVGPRILIVYVSADEYKQMRNVTDDTRE